MFTSPVYSSEPEIELKAETAVLIEAETGIVLYAKAADKPMAPASFTKIMTRSTPEAGMLLVASSMQKGMRLVSVVMNTASDQERKEDSEVLLSYGFRNYELVTLHEAGEIAAFTAVNRGRIRKLPLVARKPVAAVAPRGDENHAFTERLILSNPVEAPVEAGELIGNLQMIGPDGRVVSEADLFAAEAVERLGFFRHLLRLAGDFLAGLWRQARGEQ